MYGQTCWYAMPLKTPAAPASAEPMKNVATITRSTSMPIIAAASRSNEVARIALPSCVFRTKSVNPTISTTVPAEDRDDPEADERAHHVDVAVGEVEELEDPVHHRLAKGDQGVNVAVRD